MGQRSDDFPRSLVAFKSLWRGRLALGLTLLLRMLRLLRRCPGKWRHRDLLLLLALLLQGN